MKVKCPNCGKSTTYSTDKSYRPFCSDRCKLIDLGEWADESYKIPEKENKPSSSELNPDGEDTDQDGNRHRH